MYHIERLEIKTTDYGKTFTDKIQFLDLTQVQINYSDKSKRHFYVKFEGEYENNLQKIEFLNKDKYLIITVGNKK